MMFNPNSIAVSNGNFFGFPYSVEESELVLLSVPWDVTASYRAGTSQAPESIRRASLQMDFFDFSFEKAWETRIGTEVSNPTIADANKTYRKLSEQIIADLEQGNPANIKDLESVNKACDVVNKYVYSLCNSHLEAGKKIGLIGGDHSSPLGYLQALSEHFEDFGILHIDAHADLRNAYEGFQYSHASIMFNVLKLHAVKKLVQVGLRDVCQDEIDLAIQDERIVQYNDFALKEASFSGYTWQEQCQNIIAHLPKNVYVSLDIDALTPENCPHTGTPVPGGLSYHETIFLFQSLKKSGRHIIGFDLCEVGYSADEWDANVGARLLYKLCLLISDSN